MFSERLHDGTRRDPAPYFKRYNAKAPERGGYRKDSMGTLERLQAFRASGAALTNRALEHHGHSARVDPRRYRARRLEREPEQHLGPVDARKLRLADREARYAHRQAQREVARAPPQVNPLDLAARRLAPDP